MRTADVLWAAGLVLPLVSYLGARKFTRYIRRWRYERGARLTKENTSHPRGATLRWGNAYLPASLATQHFLVVGTTGSGKTLVQRRLMREPLLEIFPGSDKRALVFDAKGDAAAFLKKIGVRCRIYSLNPFHVSSNFVTAASWDVARDITSPARAQNLAASLIPQEKGSANRYFTDAARQVVTGVIESFIRHSGLSWTFSDLVHACLSQARIAELLKRDDDGRDVLSGFFGDERTAYQVFTTVASKLAYFRAAAALWQRCGEKLSAREWLQPSSILLLGSQATAKTSLDAINEQFFRIVVEEIDVQTNSATRRTWIWVDEARLSGPLLQSDLLPFLAVKGRSKGAALVLAFQDMEGFKEAAGERVACEIVAQCSNIALLRLSSSESAKWAASVLGQQETLEAFVSENVTGLSRSISEQRVQKDLVLPSMFYGIPVTSRTSGLTGYFVSPGRGAWRGTVLGEELQAVVVNETEEAETMPILRPEADQWLRPWTPGDRQRLSLEVAWALAETSAKSRARDQSSASVSERGVDTKRRRAFMRTCG